MVEYKEGEGKMKIVDITDIKKEKKRKAREDKKKSNAPDTNCIISTPGEKPLYLFSVRYPYKNHNFTFEFYAESMRDAEKRLYAIKTFPTEIVQIMGVHNCTIYVE